MEMSELKRQREELNISLKEVEKILPYSATTIWVYENGVREPKKPFKTVYEDFLRRVNNGEIQVVKKQRGGRTMEMRNAKRCRGAEELQRVRGKLGISSDRVGKELNLTAQTILRYEKELFLMPVDKFEQYKKFLKKVKLERIFGKKEEK